MKFLLSIVYDIKLIRNQTLKMIYSKNKENTAEENVSAYISFNECIDKTDTDGESNG